MRNNIKKPGLVLATALLVFFSGGFLLLVHIGASGRTASERVHGSAYRPPAPAAAPSYLEDFERGGGIVKRKGEALFAGIFGGPAPAAPASGRAATARYEAGGEEDPDREGDAFEEYYRKNYAAKQGRGSLDSPSSWSEGWSASASGGGGTGGGGGIEEGRPQPASAKAPAEEEAGGGGPAGASAAVPGPGSGFGKPPAVLERAGELPRLHASLPGRNSPENAGLKLGGGSGPATGGGQAYKGGSLSNMPGQKAGAALDGAAEGMKAGAQSGYNSKMAGGAAAAASGSGGSSAPSASAPKEASSAGAAAKTGGDAAKAPDKKAVPEAETGGEEEFYQGGPGASEEDFFKTVVSEKQTGLEAKLVPDAEAAVEPEEQLLAARALAEEPDKESKPADPADLKALSPARKLELKKEVHTFLRRVEHKYGKMDVIYRTSCATTPDVCREHGVTGSYLTMTTIKGAKLVLGVKYVESRWRRYTMDFKAPPAAGKPPSVPKIPEEPKDPEGPAETGDPVEEELQE